MVSVTALRDHQNYIIGYLLIGTDNTARKQVEAERARLDQVLRDKNEELENAKFVAEKANRAKSNFLASMSHELRTPLNVVIGFADSMLRDTALPREQVTEFAAAIHQAGHELLGLINTLLDVARIEQGLSLIHI